MKLEIEIPEEELRDAVAASVRKQIQNHAVSYAANQAIMKQVADRWGDAALKVVKEELGNSEELREQVREEIVRKLRAQLAGLMKTPKAV